MLNQDATLYVLKIPWIIKFTLILNNIKLTCKHVLQKHDVRTDPWV